jgi:Ca2+-binding EF-hand superfamily protein
MNKLVIGSAAAAMLAAISPAAAQVAPPPGVAQGTTVTPPMAPRAPMARMAHPGRPNVMIMMNKPMSRAEVSEHVGKMFAHLDANQDGYLTREEIQAQHQKMAAMGPDIEKRLAERGIHVGDRGAMFDRLDTNRDGNISRQEFMAGRGEVREQRVIVMRDGKGPMAHGEMPGMPNMSEMRGHPGMKMRMMHMGGMGFGGKMFDMADTNHDGRVSLAEAQAAALAHFDRADANHDGKITPDERKNVRIMRIERRG